MFDRLRVGRWIVLAAALGLTVSAQPATTTITIVATNGNQSFTPEPATAAAGGSLVWRNNDFTTHRIVLDNGSLDTGNIPPGASSAPMTLTGAGGPYHCTIHPSMVGTICAPIVLSPSTLPNVTQGLPASVTLTASGGAVPYVFAVTAGTVPAGLTLSPAGVLSGTPTIPGSSTFTVRATDTAGCFSEFGYTLTVLAAVPTLPVTFMLLLGAGLIGLGWWRLARRDAGAA